MTKSFNIKWNKFTGTQGSMLMSSSEFKEQWLYGIPLCNQVTGKSISDNVYKEKILYAQRMVENELSIKLFRQTIVETKDFIREEFALWGFLKTSWQILKPCGLLGQLNERSVITYPPEWLSIKRGNANDNTPWKELYIVPSGDASVTFSYLFTSYPYYFTFAGARQVPNYWKMTYITGFEVIPNELIELVGMIAAIQVLPMLEMTVGNVSGASFGQASQSLSMDGMSQSNNRMNGGNIFQQRLKQYQDTVKDMKTSLKGVYAGIKFDVC